ncbi:MAG: DUF1345 domain-containing protein [Anaerolineae bacterium]|nr:DUF1345 domain-containing protein [Anaerolineae bacterium]
MTSLYQPRVRWLIAIVVGIVAWRALVSIIDLDSAILGAWDLAIACWLALAILAMARANANDTLTISQRAEPSSRLMLVVTIATSLIALWASVVLASRSADRTPLEQVVHVAIGVLAVVLAWLMLHIQYALHYAQVYYDEIAPETVGVTSDPGEALVVVPFRKGLAFPDAEVVDYWDFIYYSFTIAMCYQTSDVTVTTPSMRRLTIGHSIIAFLFVTVQIAFLVSILTALWQA